MDFGELSLMDDSEVQDQVELARAQQLAAHATEGVLSELNTLVSSAQGLRSVQPERNPCVPKITSVHCSGLCLKQAPRLRSASFGCSTCEGLLGKLLEGEYQRMAKMLRDQGVRPVGYAVLGTPGGAVGRSGYRRSPAYGHGLRRWLCHGLQAHQRIRWGFRVQQPWHGVRLPGGRAIPAVPHGGRGGKPF